MKKDKYKIYIIYTESKAKETFALKMELKETLPNLPFLLLELKSI